MQYRASYLLHDADKHPIEKGENAAACIQKDSLHLLPQLGEALFFSLRDITDIAKGDHKVHIELSCQEKLTLYHLGYRYDDFLRDLFGARNELLLKDMLMHERLKKTGVKAEIDYSKNNQTKLEKEKGETRLYETGMVFIPENNHIVRIPYSDMTEIKEQDYALMISTDYDEKIVLSKMARQFDPFKQALSEAINALSVKTQSMLKELAPGVNASVIRKAARHMKEGRAAKRSMIEAISPALWQELENKLETAHIREEYDFLQSMAKKEKICIGFKRGLMGDLTGEYIWFLIPIISDDPSQPGNALAMEAGSLEKKGGNATYFFRITSRKDRFDPDRCNQQVDQFIKDLNRAMVSVNFRREPIYLPEQRLQEPRYRHYRFAVDQLPELRKLRQLFIGRVFHRDHQQWTHDIRDLLTFNVTTKNDQAKWKDEQPEPEKGETIA